MNAPTSAPGWAHPRRWIAWGFVGLLILVGVSIAVSLVLFALGNTGTRTGFYPFFGFGWGFIFLFFLFFWGLRWWGGWGWGWGGYGRRYWRYGDDAHAILRTRYARGEITKDQFEQMMRDLDQHA